MPNWSPPQPVVLYYDPAPCRAHARLRIVRAGAMQEGDQWGVGSIVSRLAEMPPQMTGRI
ncbi:hypothetical protein MGG_17312 [Pyricularia oryzae 70-15]|uniref:Uncharacterized protein n=2 Tax=Pyricularia oryzae TaxID=318829 RepID=G4NC54_PYRO7|nr:uncharacterized protein MGG_17312 [Pyricularia oryzae 70-15]EHA48203.1 hypothetical protein MGG_17312 [Pyricularia oryzae 70-15]KAI7926497.1 hypothetical protein M0657_003730 [Pyricularia oryzae]QBZ62033.1 hypothetical protein PoMZ_10907 [Pyricularia oryzae]